MIEFRNLSKRFGDKVVLDHVSLTVRTGEVLFIIGKSGAGKSVLVKHLIGLLQPDAGEIFFEGQEITHWTEQQFFPMRQRCAMVFQHSTLFDSMSIVENVALPIRKHKNVSHSESLRMAMGLLERVQMQDYAERYPADLGDGLRKRVAIARALGLNPAYLIFDEPTTALDPLSAQNVDRLIRQLSDEGGVTSLVVSHDLHSIFTIADRIVFLYQGRIRLDGTAEDFRASPDPIVQQFIRGDAEGPME